ncbi:MAG: YdeI/OmpD-associated family protein [Owenweeksia sp.]|nr:YdeI/OmpD-associated family protein [Owenweeksia sp.]
MPSLEIPPEVAQNFLNDKNKARLIITFDNGKSFHRALQRNKDGYCYMILGKTTLREAKKLPGREEHITLELDESEYGMALPEEMAEVMRQDPVGKSCFKKLKPGLQRSFLYYINSGKTVDTRIKRS